MLTRTLRPALNTAARAQPVQLEAQRNMATLREIELRLKSVRNIEKITKVCFSSGHACTARRHTPFISV
jgi:F-type H+-transporting ATPase subunit gamma